MVSSSRRRARAGGSGTKLKQNARAHRLRLRNKGATRGQRHVHRARWTKKIQANVPGIAHGFDVDRYDGSPDCPRQFYIACYYFMMAHRTGGSQPPSIDQPVPHAFPFSRKSRARVRVRVRVRVRLASSRVRAKMTSCAFVSSRVHRRSTGVGEKISVRV